MIAFYGQLSLLLALLFSATQFVLPLLGYYKNNPYFLASARPLVYGQTLLLLLTYGLLTFAFLTNDFSISYVNANSHALLPFAYKLTAVWGAHEGSILFWVLILNIWTLAFAFSRINRDLKIMTLAILGLISFCFLSFLIFTSNPFSENLGIQTGHDLNPLLQDPGFVIHPPMLYIGYVGFAVSFALTEAALLLKKVNKEWANYTRQFATAAWCFLTLGITLGSWWAYRVLGWGGFWFWDPVENASLLPWISATALIHVLVLTEKRNAFHAWAAFLALITFALSLIGTFLVRSGVLVSVHTFANDPTRGIFLLLLLAIIMSFALFIYLKQLPAQKTSVRLAFFSRDTALLLNSALLFLAMLTILLGTLYPLIFDALHLGSISVGAPYFNSVMLPLVLLILFFMSFAPLLSFERNSLKPLLKTMLQQFLLSASLAFLVLWTVAADISVLTFVCLLLCINIMLSLKNNLRIFPAMTLAHFGFAVLFIGILLSSLLSEELETRMHAGNAAKLGPYQFFFIDTKPITGANYRGLRAQFEVLKQTKHIVNLYPEKRIYPVRDSVMTKAAIHPGIFRDLYIALGEPLNQTDWSVHIYYKPFMRWVWLGGILMIFGGMLTFASKKQYFSEK